MNPCIGPQDVAKQPEPVSAKSTAEEMEKALTDLMLGRRGAAQIGTKRSQAFLSVVKKLFLENKYCF